MDGGRWHLRVDETRWWHRAFGQLALGMVTVGLEEFGDHWWGLEMATVGMEGVGSGW